jgi:hypothetical protein
VIYKQFQNLLEAHGFVKGFEYANASALEFVAIEMDGSEGAMREDPGFLVILVDHNAGVNEEERKPEGPWLRLRPDEIDLMLKVYRGFI